MGEGDDAPAGEEARDVLAEIVRRHLVEGREERVRRPFRREQQLAHVAHRPPVRPALVEVPEEPPVLLPLRLEPRRGDGRRAQGRHDPREHLALLVAPARDTDRDPPVVPEEKVRMPGERGGVRELGERVLHDSGVERAQHCVARGVVRDRRPHREPEVRAGLAEVDVRAVPQLEPGALHDAHRMARRGPGLRVCARLRNLRLPPQLRLRPRPRLHRHRLPCLHRHRSARACPARTGSARGARRRRPAPRAATVPPSRAVSGSAGTEPRRTVRRSRSRRRSPSPSRAPDPA